MVHTLVALMECSASDEREKMEKRKQSSQRVKNRISLQKEFKIEQKWRTTLQYMVYKLSLCGMLLTVTTKGINEHFDQWIKVSIQKLLPLPSKSTQIQFIYFA